MIIDNYLVWDWYVSMAHTTGTYTSTNIIDLHISSPGIPVLASGQGARDLGIGDDSALKILVEVTTTFTGAGATLAVSLQGSPDNGSGAPLGFVTWYTTPTYTLATLVAGARLMDMDMPRPPDGQPVPRFLQLSYVIGGATTTAGAINSAIVLDRHDQMYNASNNAIIGGYPPGIIIAN